MVALIADRFLCESGTDTPRSVGALRAIDTATGEIVDLRIEHAGSRAEQQGWIEMSAKMLDDPHAALIDFGFIGADRRFEARCLAARHPKPQTLPMTYVVEWLESTGPASTNILRLSDYRAVHSRVMTRDIRVRGFIPLRASLLENDPVGLHLSRSLTGRSVALLEEGNAGAPLALAFLKLSSAGAREAWAITGLASPRGVHEALVAKAAEGRAIFDAGRGGGGPAIRAAPAVADARGTALCEEAQRFLVRGRHAAAERSARAAIAAFERRRQVLHAANAAMLLGRLLMRRGRVADAHALFDSAHEGYRNLGVASAATTACVSAGLAQTDLGLCNQADETLRAGYSAASALGDGRLQLGAGVALARNMLWQNRHVDSGSLLDALAVEGEPELCLRYWCLVVRLKLISGDLHGASYAARRARDAIGGSADPAHEALVRTAEARVQGKLGDVEALEFHVRIGLRAAAGARLPLQAIRLRLTLIEGLLDADRARHPGNLANRLKAMGRLSLPLPLKNRLNRALEMLLAPAARESAPCFSAGETLGASNLNDVDALTQVFSLCHELENERDALNRAAAAIKKHTFALAVGIFGSTEGGPEPFGVAGSVNNALARRCVEVGQPIQPERRAGGVEAATPIRYLGRMVGAVTGRWSVEGPASV